MCQISRKLTNRIKFPSFTFSSKNSAKVNLPTRWYCGTVDTAKEMLIKSKSNSLKPLVKTLRPRCIRDPVEKSTRLARTQGEGDCSLLYGRAGCGQHSDARSCD